MSVHLPFITGREAAKAFAKAGFVMLKARGKGSHMAMFRETTRTLLIIPDHDPVKRGTLRSLIRDAGMSVDEFRELL